MAKTKHLSRLFEGFSVDFISQFVVEKNWHLLSTQMSLTFIAHSRYEGENIMETIKPPKQQQQKERHKKIRHFKEHLRNGVHTQVHRQGVNFKN